MVTYQDLRKVCPGTPVKYYSRTGRNTKDHFTVLEISDIKILPEAGKPRLIRKEKFEEVASRWNEREIASDHEIKDGNLNLSYVRGLIHHGEA